MTERPKVWDPKDPDDIADYWFDFTRLIADEFRAIVNATVDVPSPVTNPGDDYEYLGQTVRVRLAGGDHPVDYPIGCHVTLDNGEEFDMTSKLKVRERTK